MALLVPKAPLMESASCSTEVAFCDPQENSSIPGLADTQQAPGLSGPTMPSASSAISQAWVSLLLLPFSGVARDGPPLL